MRKHLNTFITFFVIVVGASASYFGSGPRTITPSVGTPGFVQAAEAHQTTSASPLTATFGSTPVQNDVVFVATVATAGSGSDNQAMLVTDNKGNAYARVGAFPVNGSTTGVAGLWCAPVISTSASFQVSLAQGAGATQKGLIILEYGHTSCNPDKTTGASGATSPYACGTLTTTNPKDLLLTFLSPSNLASGTVTFTAPASFTIRQSFGTAASGLPVAVADRIISATNSFSPTFQASQNLASTPCLFVAMISQ